MYGEPIGKFVLFVIVIILCLLRLCWVLLAMRQSARNGIPPGMSAFIRLLLPIAFIYLAWRLLWH